MSVILKIDPYFYCLNEKSSPVTADNQECISANWGKAGSLKTPQMNLASSQKFFLLTSWKTAVPENRCSKGGITYTLL